MKTEELLGLLAADATPVPRHAAEKRLGLALLAGLGLAAMWVMETLGVRADLAQVAATGMFWGKVGMPALTGLVGAVVVWRLAHPGLRAGWPGWLALLPVLLLWSLAGWDMSQATVAERQQMVFGGTWRVCSFNIVVTALPVGVMLFWALRGLAPTRPVLTGAAAGWLAGAVAAMVYSLHCPEMEAPFLAVWYVLGMAMSAGLGALAGARLLRW